MSVVPMEVALAEEMVLVGADEAVAVDRGAAERDANELGVGEGGETNAGKGGVDLGAVAVNRD